MQMVLQAPMSVAPRPRFLTIPRGAPVSAFPQRPGPDPAHRCTRVSAAKIPDRTEDKDAAHTAFQNAFEHSKPPSIKIEGLQEYASAVRPSSRGLLTCTSRSLVLLISRIGIHTMAYVAVMHGTVYRLTQAWLGVAASCDMCYYHHDVHRWHAIGPIGRTSGAGSCLAGCHV